MRTSATKSRSVLGTLCNTRSEPCVWTWRALQESRAGRAGTCALPDCDTDRGEASPTPLEAAEHLSCVAPAGAYV